MPAVFNPASWTPVVLAWSFLLLLPFGRSSELPIFVMAILGGTLIWKHGKHAFWQGGAKTFSMLFLCIWVPIVLSVPDSLWFKKSLSTALTFPRIWLAGIYMIWVLKEEVARERLLKLSAWLLLFWVFDALVQAVMGYDLLGHAYPQRLNGPFGEGNLKLGLTLAVLSPIILEHASRKGSRWKLAATWGGITLVVLLANNRESWIVFALVSLGWGWAYAKRLGLHPIRLLAPVAIFALASALATYKLNSTFADRVDSSLAALDFTYESVNTASSMRLHLWGNAVDVIENHPFNGAGVRAYRYAYAQHAAPGDPYVNSDGTGIVYAHQLLLEVGSETGLIGFIGLLGFFFIYLQPTWNKENVHPLAWAGWLGAFAWLFPINTHTALYSAYWSTLLWWLIAVSVVAIKSDHEQNVAGT